MEPPPAIQACNNTPAVGSQREEDTQSASLPCFPFLRLPFEIQLMIYRCALTRPHSIPLQTGYGLQTQETVVGVPSLVPQPNSPCSVVSGHADIGNDAPALNAERDEISSQSVDATTSEVDVAPVQRYPFISFKL
jgi:hypothetical protein